MPEFEMRRMDISYTCPECSTRLEVDISFIAETTKEVNYSKGLWCPRCNARHRINYSVSLTRNKDVKFKVKEFLSNDENYKKRFKVLNP